MNRKRLLELAIAGAAVQLVDALFDAAARQTAWLTLADTVGEYKALLAKKEAR